MIFHNSQLELSELPKSDRIDFEPLLLKFKTLQYIQWSIFSLIFFVGANAIIYYNDAPIFISFIFSGVFILIVILRLVLIHVGFEYKGYALREYDVHYKTGIINRKISTIPVNRIQHMEIRQGFIARLLGLSKLKLFTAGDSSSDLSLRGISPETAQQIKDLLTEKIKGNEQN